MWVSHKFYLTTLFTSHCHNMWADLGLLAGCLMQSPGVCATHSCLPCFPSPLPHPTRSSFPLPSPVTPSRHPSSLTVFRKRRRATRPSLPLRQNVCFYWQGVGLSSGSYLLWHLFNAATRSLYWDGQKYIRAEITVASHSNVSLESSWRHQVTNYTNNLPLTADIWASGMFEVESGRVLLGVFYAAEK